MCPGWGSNPHEDNPHRILSPARLPIPPPGHKVILPRGARIAKWGEIDNAIRITYSKENDSSNTKHRILIYYLLIQWLES